MLEEDREAIRKMKADFEDIAELTDNEFKPRVDFVKCMNHYNTVYTAATRIAPNSKSISDSFGYDVGELLYMDFQEMLTRYLLKYRDLSASSETLLFTKVLKVWGHYKILMRWNMKVFDYLSRYYIKINSKPSLQEVALSIFLEQILKKHAPTVSVVTQELLQSERDGECVNRDQIRSAVELLSSVSIEKTREIYVEQFFKPYLAMIRTHYDSRLLEWGMSNTSSEFLENVEKAHTEEETRCQCYFPLEDQEKIMSYVDEILLDSSVTVEKLLQSKCGFVATLRDRKAVHLKMYYNLFARDPKRLIPLASLVRDQIIREGEERLRQHDCEEKSMDIKSCVADVIKLQEEYVHLLSHFFSGNPTLFKAVKDGLEQVFSGGIRVSSEPSNRARRVPVSELFAYYLDAILQGQDITFEEQMGKTLSILTYITERDTFIAHSRDLLAQRIIFPRKKFDEALERSVIQRIGHCFGMSSISSLEAMLNDVDISQDFKGVEKRLDVVGDKPFELNVLVLKRGIWPHRIRSEDFTPPRLVGQTLQAFQKFYLKGTSGRVLTWSHSSSVGDISAAFKCGTRLISMSGLQCWVMLAFNQAKILTPSDMMNLFSVSLDDLKPALFALVKWSLLLRETDSKTLQVHDKFLVNENFSSKWKKTRIPTVISRITTSHSETIAKEVEEDRKPAIDACLVRIMKSRRIISHADLVEECHQQLSPLFQADHKTIKQQIEELLRKEYIERDPETAGVYRYAA